MTLDSALNHAIALHDAGKLAEAEAIYRQILAADPNHPVALERLAGIADHFGHHKPAEQLARRALGVRPTPDGFAILGTALAGQNDLRGAEDAMRQSLALAPNVAALHANLAMILWQSRRPAEAREAYAKALELEPNLAEAEHGLMACEGDLGHFQSAVEHGRRAAELGLTSTRFWGDFAVALHEIGDLRGAIAAAERAVSLDPVNATTHFNLSQLLLLDGQFDRGWREQEWRWGSQGFPSPKRNFPQPLWDGKRSAGGEATVLLHAEQGAGDTIMAARYIPLAAEWAKVIVECPANLVELIRTVDSAAQVIPQGEPLGAFEAQAPMMSLPMIFQTRVETIPARVPYLKADPARVAAWRTRLAGKRGRKVGIAWAGTPAHVNDVNRSMPFAQLAPFSQVESVAFYSLQKGPRASDARDAFLPGGWLTDWTDDLHDYADTAALIECLDLVVTVDTSVAHLAGALGKEVWVMLPFAPDWRWLARFAEMTPWYPTMRLFRQSRPRAWGEVIEKVTAQLCQI